MMNKEKIKEAIRVAHGSLDAVMAMLGQDEEIVLPEPPEGGYKVLVVGEGILTGYQWRDKCTSMWKSGGGAGDNCKVEEQDNSWYANPLTGQAFVDKCLPPGTKFEYKKGDFIRIAFSHGLGIVLASGYVVDKKRDIYKTLSPLTVKILHEGK